MWVNQNYLNDKPSKQNSGAFSRDYNITMLDQQHQSPKKMKRFRSAFTTDQVNYLEKQFKKFPYIGNAQRKELAQALNIPERAIKIWFQNRRMKEKKESTAKEFDEEQGFLKSLEFAKDQLNNARVQSTNDQQSRSLPLLVDMSHATCKNTATDLCDTVLGRNAQDLGIKDSRTNTVVTPNLITTTKVIYPPPAFINSNNTTTDYITTGEPLIDMSTKYKYESELKNVDTVRKTAAIEPIIKKEVLDVQNTAENLSKKPAEQLMPEDLSSNRKTILSTTVPQQGPSRNMSNSSGYVSLVPTVSPFYAQPYISAGGVIWKPMEVMPVVSTASAAIPTATVPAPLLDLSTVSETATQKGCNCDCHIKPRIPFSFQQQSPTPQYIITALPYQNPSTKY